MAVVKTTRNGLRPSMPTEFGVSAFVAGCAGARDAVLGQSAVEIRVRTSPTSGFGTRGSTTSKINYMGTTSYLVAGSMGSEAPADGAAKSIIVDWNVATTRHQKAQLDLATGGGTARGNPPRGKPV